MKEKPKKSEICCFFSKLLKFFFKRNIAILEIKGKEFRITPIPLQTVRPYILDELVLSTVPDLEDSQEAITEVLAGKVEEMVAKALSEIPQGNKAVPDKPLIRLKVEYSGFSTVNPSRFGQRFVGTVANPNEILLFYKKRTTSSSNKKRNS